MTDAEQIAAKLTAAQKRAVLCASDGVIPTCYPTALRIAQPTFRALRNHGVTEYWPPRLTPLGLAVRAILQEQPHDR